MVLFNLVLKFAKLGYGFFHSCCSVFEFLGQLFNLLITEFDLLFELVNLWAGHELHIPLA